MELLFMNSIDFIRTQMELSKSWILGLAADLQDAPLTTPTPNGGNHPLWTVGHLAYSEANIINAFAQGKENPLAQWQDLFGIGSQPVTDASHYPPYLDLLARFEAVRADTLVYLDTLTEDDLDKPSHAPEEMKDYFSTIGNCLAVLTTHLAFHGGQLADARRALGRAVLMG
jgi:uncharacterized damage-inducible protein DinB